MRYKTLPIVLFGYDSSPFTQKIRLALRFRQLPYTFLTVPSMMPRPILRDTFNLTYRKIPVLAIGRDIYSDTSIIIEALENLVPANAEHPSLYPLTADGRNCRPMMRGFASFWTDRPLFRVATGLIPGSVWKSRFGTDRSALIGHKLDAHKLEVKVPRNLASLDLHLSILEPQFSQNNADHHRPWIFSTSTPSIADISLYYQLDWARDISAGRGLSNLTAGEVSDTNGPEIIRAVFNQHRYPAIYHWFETMRRYIEDLPSTEVSNLQDPAGIIESLRVCKIDDIPAKECLLPTPRPILTSLEEENRLVPGSMVKVAPDDTGRDDPTIGKLVALSPEEIVIHPSRKSENAMEVRAHFPRIGFVVTPYSNHTKR